MGVGYCLINNSKREKISFYNLPANTAKELTGNPATSAITTWYLLKNIGDEIGFVPDQYSDEDWPYKNITWDDINNYVDLTTEIVNELINIEVLTDNGIEVFDKDDPDIYIRRLKNIWQE